MSWADLLIEMDALFVLPALLTAAFMAWRGAGLAARLYQSVEGFGPLGIARGAHEDPAPMRRRLQTASNLRMK